MNQLRNMQRVKPQPSRKCRTSTIMSALSDHFKGCWEHVKSASPKLEFYHMVKSKFLKEPYLDVVNNAQHRHRMTRLRISAHDFEIEQGRYKSITREDRVCKWCLLTLNSRLVEDEHHVLYVCDLHSRSRNKLVTDLQNAPSLTPVGQHISTHADHGFIKDNLMNLISPHTEADSAVITTSLHQIPVIRTRNTVESESDVTTTSSSDHNHSVELRAYIYSSVCAFVSRCFDNRYGFAKDRAARVGPGAYNLTINL